MRQMRFCGQHAPLSDEAEDMAPLESPLVKVSTAGSTHVVPRSRGFTLEPPLEVRCLTSTRAKYMQHGRHQQNII